MDANIHTYIVLAILKFAVFGVFVVFISVKLMKYHYVRIARHTAIPTIGYTFLCDKY